MPYFLLNDITLFYHDISSSFTQPSKLGSAVKNWRSLAVNHTSRSKHEGPGSLAESSHTAVSTTVQSKRRTTASSSAAWIKTGKANDMTVSHGATSEVKGFNDEDETEEREHALSSPIKGNKQLDSTVSSTNCSNNLLKQGHHQSGADPATTN